MAVAAPTVGATTVARVALFMRGLVPATAIGRALVRGAAGRGSISAVAGTELKEGGVVPPSTHGEANEAL